MTIFSCLVRRVSCVQCLFLDYRISIQADAVEVATKQNSQLLLLLQREEANSQKLRFDTHSLTYMPVPW